MTPKLIKKRRTKNKISYELPVLVVSKSNKNILAQIIEPTSKKTLVTFTSSKISKKSKTEKSIEIAKEISKFLNKQKISKVVFDRNGYIYHGRVKALVETVKSEGIEI